MPAYTDPDECPCAGRVSNGRPQPRRRKPARLTNAARGPICSPTNRWRFAAAPGANGVYAAPGLPGCADARARARRRRRSFWRTASSTTRSSNSTSYGENPSLGDYLRSPTEKSHMKRSPLTIAIAFLLILIFGLMLFVFQAAPIRGSGGHAVRQGWTGAGSSTNAGPYCSPGRSRQVYNWINGSTSVEDRLEPLTLAGSKLRFRRGHISGWRIDNPVQVLPQVPRTAR